MNPKRLVIVGGVAAGMAAAARARRLSEEAEIIVVEKGPDVSFANCGMPYHVAGEIGERSKLVLQTPESLRQLLNLDVRLNAEAVRIDRQRRMLSVVSAGNTTEIPYDKLILAPGAMPVCPPIPGIDDPRILTLRTLSDMDRIEEKLAVAKRVLIVGAGFIGLEMAEALVRRKLQVTVIEQQSQVLPLMDAEMTNGVGNELRLQGVELILGDGLAGFESVEGGIVARLSSGRRVSGEMVILSIGVRCDSRLASEAGLELGMRGSIRVNEFQQTSDSDIYAAGDAVETADRVLGCRTVVPLGGPAGRQGRVAADHIFLGEKAMPYPGSLGTAVVRVFDSVAAVTGWTEKRLRQEKIPFEPTLVTAFQHAGYFPGATPVALKILWDPAGGRLLGAQAAGVDGVDKRIDVLATAIAARMTVGDLCHLELAYAPPFGSARDVVNLAGFAAQNVRDGLSRPIHSIPADPNIQILDVRPKASAEADPLAGARNIPMEELRQRVGELDRSKPVVTVCALGKIAYFAQRVLAQLGFQCQNHVGGLNIFKTMKNFSTPSVGGPPETAATNPVPVSGLAPMRLDACGLSCPGPIMKVREAVNTLAPGQELAVKVSDPGFASDFAAFCSANGLELIGLEKEKGIYTGRLRKPALTVSTVPATGEVRRTGSTIVLFSCELDKALAAFVIANGSLAMGGQTTLFFTFWGLNVLRKDYAASVEGKTFMDRMFGWMMPKGAGALPLSRMHMGGLGTRMMKWRMASKNLPSLPGLMDSARKGGVRLVACSMSMEAMGLKKEELIDGVEVGGVADFLGAAAKSGSTLFI
ncbi:MAG: FAD-dependent oxidoreductase [Verrucomicrobiae bacterium]|nr:FAD-dependent oxidoreductase [Verrucomicrobiae bacterium]